MYKLGVRGHDFGSGTCEYVASTIKNAGFDATQLAVQKSLDGIKSQYDMTDRLLEEVRETFAKHQLEISVYGCYIEPSLKDKEDRLKQVDSFLKGIENAEKLGVKVIGTETTHFREDESNRKIAYERLLDSVLRMTEKAVKHNVTIGIEPVAEHTLNSPELTCKLLDTVNCENLKVIYDNVNLLLPTTADVNSQRRIIDEVLTGFGNKIVAMHIKDVNVVDNELVWSVIGEGIVDYNYLFEKLKKYNLNVSLLREGATIDSYKKDLEFIKKFVV